MTMPEGGWRTEEREFLDARRYPAPADWVEAVGQALARKLELRRAQVEALLTIAIAHQRYDRLDRLHVVEQDRAFIDPLPPPAVASRLR